MVGVTHHHRYKNNLHRSSASEKRIDSLAVRLIPTIGNSTDFTTTITDHFLTHKP